MTTVHQRIDALLASRDLLEPWLGPLDADSLRALVEAQLGSLEALDAWISRGDTRTKAVPVSPLLHVISGNTPHSAFQSVVRGLLVGSYNRVKLPSAGIPEFEAWAALLPDSLSGLIEIRHNFPESWCDSAGAVVFGQAATLETFRGMLPPGLPIIEHGPKLSIGAVFEPDDRAAELATRDILAYEQRGCLSLQAIYVAGGPIVARAFSERLAAAMARHRSSTPRPPLALSESGAISNARELIRFREANGDDVALWESSGDTAWTVVYQTDPTLAPGPLNGYVTVHPLPSGSRLRDSLGPESTYLSTVALHPFNDSMADRLEPLSAPRTCALGNSQQPPLFWHHDGRMPLADLVTWRDRS
ncbi:MAG: acyl-CoA reductase [Luteolibacter sp.]